MASMHAVLTFFPVLLPALLAVAACGSLQPPAAGENPAPNLAVPAEFGRGFVRSDAVHDDREAASPEHGLLETSLRKSHRRLAPPRALSRSPADPGGERLDGLAFRRLPVPHSIQAANPADLTRLCRRLL